MIEPKNKKTKKKIFTFGTKSKKRILNFEGYIKTSPRQDKMSISAVAPPMMISGVKGNPNLGQGSMPLYVKRNTDGTISYALPSNAPPDSIAYNKNRVFQMERKTKMVARLRAKLVIRE